MSPYGTNMLKFSIFEVTSEECKGYVFIFGFVLCFLPLSERVPYVPPQICLQETCYYFVLAFLAKERNKQQY